MLEKLQEEIKSKERFPGSISVGLLLTHGRSNRLLLTRHGVKKGEVESWGLVAGGVKKGEDAWEAALREAMEEAHLQKDNIIFVPGRNDPEPHPVLINREAKNSLGLVFDVTYSGPKIPLDGWEIQEDSSVDRAQFFTWQQVLDLLNDKSKIYLPEFNYSQLLRWMLKPCWKNQKRIAETNKWFLEREQSIEGLHRKNNDDTRKSGNPLSSWEYIPPYNHWMTIPGIHGLPERTNFARERFIKSQ